MTRSRIAAFLALAFIVLFCFSGVTATTTVKDATVSIQMGMPKLLFSLSSAPLLLIPLALRGVTYKPIGASALLRRNLFIYGLGGIIVPFIGIKLIDMLVSVFF